MSGSLPRVAVGVQPGVARCGQEREDGDMAEYDPMRDLIESNRDELLRMHEEAIRRVRRCLSRGDLTTTWAVLDALRLFHPMHGESWTGWPEGSEPTPGDSPQIR